MGSRITLNGIVIGLNNEEGQSLSGLVTDRGYSKPTKTDPLARADIVARGVVCGTVEVERRGDKVFATLLVPEAKDVDECVRSVLKDFADIGVLAW